MRATPLRLFDCSAWKPANKNFKLHESGDGVVELSGGVVVEAEVPDPCSLCSALRLEHQLIQRLACDAGGQ